MKVLVAFSLLSLSVPAVAKCIHEDYVVYGTLRDRSERPVPGIEVEIQWFELTGVRTAKGISDSRGRYSITLNVDFLTGETHAGDLCGDHLKTIRVVARGKAFAGMALAEVKGTRVEVNLAE